MRAVCLGLGCGRSVEDRLCRRGPGAALTMCFPPNQPAEPKAAFTAQSGVAQAGVPSRVCCCSRETDVVCGCEQHHRADKTWALPPSVTVPSRTTASKAQHHQLRIPTAETEAEKRVQSYLSAPQMRTVQPCFRDGPSSLSTEQEPQTKSSALYVH